MQESRKFLLSGECETLELKAQQTLLKNEAHSSYHSLNTAIQKMRASWTSIFKNREPLSTEKQMKKLPSLSPQLNFNASQIHGIPTFTDGRKLKVHSRKPQPKCQPCSPLRHANIKSSFPNVDRIDKNYEILRVSVKNNPASPPFG